jgi:hypothetical protein
MDQKELHEPDRDSPLDPRNAPSGDRDRRAPPPDHRPAGTRDAWPKAIGLAEYEDKHAHDYGRIELVMVERDKVHRLDLTDATVRSGVKNITTNEQLKKLFRDSGS